MKIIRKTSAIYLLVMIFLSCTDRDTLNEFDLSKNQTEQHTKSFQNSSQNNAIQYSKSELIIRYKLGTPSSIKTILRNYYNVVSFETCKHCPDKDIELWNFGKNIQIEPKKGVIEMDSEDPENNSSVIDDVDFEFDFFMESSSTNKTSSYNRSTTDFTSSTDTMIKMTNDGITIAVIDTGIDTSIPVFSNPFLYNAEADGLEGITSGWDFTNNDADPNDNESEKHGTVVTKTINELLNNMEVFDYGSGENHGIKHQILPIKAFNSSGSGSYFDVVCGLNHALRYADVINMSFGWYVDGDFNHTIFSGLLDDYPNTIIVTSAGNEHNNNDIIKHFPSGYLHNNIFSIAATKANYSDIADYSNYGLNSVDYFASGKAMLLEHGPSFYGTSFAAPKVTALIAAILSETEATSTDDIIGYLNSLGFSANYEGYPVKYNRVLVVP